MGWPGLLYGWFDGTLMCCGLVCFAFMLLCLSGRLVLCGCVTVRVWFALVWFGLVGLFVCSVVLP